MWYDPNNMYTVLWLLFIIKSDDIMSIKHCVFYIIFRYNHCTCSLLLLKSLKCKHFNLLIYVLVFLVFILLNINYYHMIVQYKQEIIIIIQIT